MQRTEALTRLTLRLARMAEGSDDTIDEALARIRRLIHDNADGRELASASDQLAKVVMTVTGESPDKTSSLPPAHDLSGLSSIIQAMPLRAEDHQRMTDLVRQISGDSSQGERQKALGELLSSATAALKEVATRQNRSEKGGVRGLFKRRGTDSQDYDHFLELFTGLVHRLVDHIDVINGSQVRSKALRDALTNVTVVDQAQALLREVTREMDSIDSRVRQERLQTSDFLDTLRERLGGFEELVVDVARGGELSVQRSESLQSHVAADVDQLSDATRSGDLEAIRQAFDETLQKITQHMAEHVDAEREQHKAAQEKVDALSEQLTRLETESEVLRTEIRNKTDLAVRDQLTGVFNRNGFDERAEELFARWARNGAKLSIVFVDCNKFKEINDTFGHAAGDLVLVKVADVLSSRARVTDVVCRYGGDEFVILMPDTPIDGAETYAVSAYEEVLNVGFNDNGKRLDVSISLGITALREGDTLEAALARADEAMYEAKSKQGVRVSKKV